METSFLHVLSVRPELFISSIERRNIYWKLDVDLKYGFHRPPSAALYLYYSRFLLDVSDIRAFLKLDPGRISYSWSNPIFDSVFLLAGYPVSGQVARTDIQGTILTYSYDSSLTFDGVFFTLIFVCWAGGWFYPPSFNSWNQ